MDLDSQNRDDLASRLYSVAGEEPVRAWGLESDPAAACGWAASSWRQHTTAEFYQLSVAKTSTQGVLFVPCHPITDLDRKPTAERGNLNELDGGMWPD
jgi:hypothetical protein